MATAGRKDLIPTLPHAIGDIEDVYETYGA
jgi:hypothetical protein